MHIIDDETNKPEFAAEAVCLVLKNLSPRRLTLILGTETILKLLGTNAFQNLSGIEELCVKALQSNCELGEKGLKMLASIPTSSLTIEFSTCALHPHQITEKRIAGNLPDSILLGRHCTLRTLKITNCAVSVAPILEMCTQLEVLTLSVTVQLDCFVKSQQRFSSCITKPALSSPK